MDNESDKLAARWRAFGYGRIAKLSGVLNGLRTKLVGLCGGRSKRREAPTLLVGDPALDVSQMRTGSGTYQRG